MNLLLIVFLIPCIFAFEKKVLHCSRVLQEGGASSQFAMVGHEIHSLSVRTLRKFKPDVTEDNIIPTINMDLSSNMPILPYAPDRSTPENRHYRTDGSVIFDEV